MAARLSEAPKLWLRAGERMVLEVITCADAELLEESKKNDRKRQK
jgi:hypothetical protein